MVLLEGNRRPPAKSRHAPFSTVSPAPALLRLTVLGRHRSVDAASISSFLLPNTPTSLHHRKMPPRPSEDCHFKHRVAPSIERQKHPLDGVTVLRQRRDVQRYQQRWRESQLCMHLIGHHPLLALQRDQGTVQCLARQCSQRRQLRRHMPPIRLVSRWLARKTACIASAPSLTTGAGALHSRGCTCGAGGGAASEDDAGGTIEDEGHELPVVGRGRNPRLPDVASSTRTAT